MLPLLPPSNERTPRPAPFRHEARLARADRLRPGLLAGLYLHGSLALGRRTEMVEELEHRGPTFE